MEVTTSKNSNTTFGEGYRQGHGHSSTDLTMMIVHNVIASVGIVGNITVVIALGSDQKLRIKVPNIFIINQSLIDFCASVVLLLSNLTVRNTYHVDHQGALGYLQCGVWNTRLLLWGLFVASTWNLVTLTVERYLELIHPLWHRARFKMRWVYSTTALCWVFGIGLNAAYMIPTSQIINGECEVFNNWPCEEVKSAFGVGLIFIQFFIPLIILLYCYGRILHMLSRKLHLKRTDQITVNNMGLSRAGVPYTIENHPVSSTNMESRNGNSKNTFQIARKNTIKTLLIVAFCFVTCWSNNQVYYLMYNLGFDVDWNGIFYHFTILMVFLNCIVNPFVYLISYKDYQTALKRFLHRGDKSK